MLGRRGDRLRWCGADLAAHCINDVLTTGAEPLFFLDYVAANTIDVEQVAELIEGAADVCRAAGCAILGGETAELPGIYREDELDFCGTAVGVVDRDRVVDGSRVEAGDVVIGFASAGIHANGFSLVRRIVGDGAFDADLLLPPTRLYLDEVRALRARADVRALAHVTGGGIAGNLARVLPDGLGAVVDPASWERPEVFELAGRQRRRRGRAAARLQHRDRLLRRRPGRGRSRRRPRDRDGRPGQRGRRGRDAGRGVGVLVSGSGTNLQALIDAGIPIAAVASNVAGARALERAAADRRADRGVRARPVRRTATRATRRWRTWLVGARGRASSSAPGTCTCCDRSFLARFPGRVVNVHPALLPAFPGAHAVEEALAAGATETGATVHLVDEGVDTGAVLRQEAVAVLPGDTARDAARAHQGRRAPASAGGRQGVDRRMRRALLSVYDKTGIAAFAQELRRLGLRARRERRHGATARRRGASR